MRDYTDTTDFAGQAQEDFAQAKLPPHSLQSEQAVLGGLLLDNSAWERMGDVLVESDFYRQAHCLIFRQLFKLIEAGKPADIVTVSEALERTAQLDSVGGTQYLIALAQGTHSTANIRQYAELVRERSILRALASVGNNIADSVYNSEGRTAEQLLDTAEAQVFKIAESTSRGREGFLNVASLLPEIVARIDTLYNRADSSDITGISTGFVDLDKMTSGLQKGDLIIVAGRPSMGKTAFSVNIAENVALDAGKAVAIFSMEMAATQLAIRMIGSVGRLDSHKLRTGRLLDDDWQQLSLALGRLNDARIFIDETPALTARDVRARARRLHRQHGGLGLIVLDYIQLMAGNSKDQNRTAEVSEISRSLKALARELNVPIIALSQLNRSVEQRQDKRPMMSDLRESGAIEQDADLIVFLYRDEYYNKDSPDKGLAEVIIAKQRNGPTGTVRLAFLGQYSRFESAAIGYGDGEPQPWS